MADQNKARQISEKIRQTIEKLREALDDWGNGQRLRPQPVPIPVDRPYPRKIARG